MKKQDYKHKIIQITVIVAAVILMGKLAQIQLFSSDFQDQANQAALFQKTSFPSRGLIYDRNGKLLVVNEPIYELLVIYKELSPDMDTSLFCKILDISQSEFEERINKDWSSVRYSKSVPFSFINKIEPHVYARLQEFLHDFPGFYPNVRNVRAYPERCAAHVLGYLSEISSHQLEKDKDKYQLGDYIGVSGLEKSYESVLKGSKGVKFVLKDNMGREVGEFANGALDSSATSGVDIISSLDIELQKLGEELLQNKSGSIVAIEPSTGEILAMVSVPNYDPNLLSIKKDRSAAYKSLLADKIGKPFLDRSVMAKYPPGSIFKPILSLIALQEGITYPSRTIFCNGEYVINKGYSQGCRNHPVPLDIGIAIQYSCNSYFYQLIREFIEIEGYSNPGKGLALLGKYLNAFGVGQPLGVDISHENAGNIPTPEYYDNLYKDEFYGWRSTYILSLGIGQGELELTTLQMANLAAIIANRGHFYTPHLVRNFTNQNYRLTDKYKKAKKVPIDSIHFAPVIEGMNKVIYAGSGASAGVRGIDVCGKTGTSQNPHGEDHSVFFAFAPKVNPKIAIAVYVENAGSGSSTASPIAGLMIEKYLNGEIAENRNWLKDKIVNRVILNRT